MMKTRAILLSFLFVIVATGDIKIDKYEGTNNVTNKTKFRLFNCTTVECGKGILSSILTSIFGEGITNYGFPLKYRKSGGVEIYSNTDDEEFKKLTRTKREWKEENYRIRGYDGYRSYKKGSLQGMPKIESHGQKLLRSNWDREFNRIYNRENYGVAHNIEENTEISNTNRKRGNSIGIGRFKTVRNRHCRENNKRVFCSSQNRSTNNNNRNIEEIYPNYENIAALSNEETSYHEKKTEENDDKIASNDEFKEEEHKDCKCKEKQEVDQEQLARHVVLPKPKNDSTQEDSLINEEKPVDTTTFKIPRLVAPQNVNLKNVEKLTTIANNDSIENITEQSQ